jgi:hypothetical protein
MLPMSRLQMSGLKAWIWRTIGRPAEGRAGAGLARIVGPGLEASAGAGGEVDDDLDPAVADALDHLAVMGQLHAGLPVSGLRTWIWTTAAPALAASMAERAMASGVTGTAGFLRGVSALPVTAQQIMTRRDISRLLRRRPRPR